MKIHQKLDDAVIDQVTQYVLGVMNDIDAAKFGEHMKECSICRAQVAELQPAVDGLVESASEIAPPPTLKQQVLQSIRRESFSLVRASTSEWQETGVVGVTARLLSLQPDTQQRTILLRMNAGSSYPIHRHSDVEECFVIQGDLQDGHISMQAGDFIRYVAGSSHGPLSTQHGNMLLLRSGTDDEILT